MPYRLLLADDSPTIQKVVELLLSSENFEIKSVNDGEEALRTIDSFKPDIVLADIDMPTINGYQLCERIKKDPSTSSIPVILLAGAFEPFDKNYAKSVLADDFIIKPFESKELISKVQKVLSNYESLKEVIEKEWDEEAFSEEVGQETKEEGLNEEFESETALSEGIEKVEIAGIFDLKESKEAIKEKEELVKGLPSAEEIGEIIKKAIDERISALIENNILPYISFTIKDSVESAVTKATPKIIEEIAKSMIEDLLESLKVDIRTTINNVVPQIAEEIIRKEIEKISSESIQ